MPWRIRQILAVLSLGCALTSWAYADVSPAKPYPHLVSEVVEFLFSDVGDNGIRTNDGDPDGYPVPPYFYSYAINDQNDLDGNLNGYPFYLSVSYPAYTAAVAIDAFLDWRRFSGDDEGLTRAREYADWILEHRTPAGDLYGNLPYSTQTDGVMGGGWDGLANMTDKPPMFGLRLLRLYDITGEAIYLDGALEIADVLAATQLTGGPEDDGRWPFRAVPADGTVTQDYTSHLTPAVRFFDDLAARTGSPVYAQTRDRAWAWLLANPCDPASASYMRWEGFYEDQDPAMQTGSGDHYSGNEMIAELVARRPVGWEDLAVTLLDSMSVRYLVESPSSLHDPYTPVTLEWTGWPQATYAASLQYARTALLLYQALEGDPRQDDNWRQIALAMAAACSHGQNNRGITADGRMFTTVRDLVAYYNDDSWYEQNFNTVKYFLEIMSLEPALAQVDECHILSASEALTSIVPLVDGACLEYATAGGAGRERIKVPDSQVSVWAGGFEIPELPGPPEAIPGWFYEEADGVVTIYHDASPVVLSSGISSVPTAPGFQVQVHPNPFNPRTTISWDLPAAGHLRVDIFDTSGRRVRRLMDEAAPAGTGRTHWDGRNEKGSVVAAGVYYFRMEFGHQRISKKVTLLK